MRIPNTWTSIFLILTGYIVIKGETDTGRTAITIKNGILHTVSTARLAHRHTLYDYVDGILPPKAMSQGLNLNT